jgi:hypothetical protein
MLRDLLEAIAGELMVDLLEDTRDPAARES